MPHELSVGDVYFSPLLPVISIALIAAWVTITLLNKLRVSRYIMFPNASFLALMTLYILLMNDYWIKI
ncbi:MAG: hypothetical protein ACI9JM_003180 [Halioglobus sp.]